MQSLINLKIKFREGFRPFAPSVLDDRAREYFDLDAESPYMLIVAPVKEERRLPLPEGDERWGIDLLNEPRSDIPAVTHLDYSARVQTVTSERTPAYHALIAEFERRTGCPLVVNTSFNVRGEPIVCTAQDAYRCFMRTHLDYLVVGPFLLAKSEQPAFNEEAWQNSIPLD
jgi:carbamoyltransferase